MRIVVDPDQLRRVAQQMRNTSNELGNVSNRVGNALSGMDFESRQKVGVESQVNQARSRANALASRSGDLARYLDDKARAFEEADRGGMSAIGQVNAGHLAVMREWIQSPLYSIYAFPGQDAGDWMRLGDPNGVPQDPTLAVLPIGAGIVAGVGTLISADWVKRGSQTTSQVTSVAGHVMKEVTKTGFVSSAAGLGRYMNHLVGNQKAGWVGRMDDLASSAYQPLKWLGTPAGSVGVGFVFDTIATGDYSRRGVGTSLAKNVIELGLAKVTVPSAIVQLGGTGWLWGTTEAGKFIAADPEHDRLLDESSRRAGAALKKIDVGNITRDLGAFVWDAEVETRIATAEAQLEAWRNPTCENILRATVMGAVPESALLFDSNIRKNVAGDVSSLVGHTGDFIIGVPETIIEFGRHKLTTDAVIASEIGSRITETSEGILRWLNPSY